MEYPSETSVELALRRLANESGDDTVVPFVLHCSRSMAGSRLGTRLWWSRPNSCCCARGLGQVLGRSFSLGVRSFLLTVPEALRLILKYEGVKPTSNPSVFE